VGRKRDGKGVIVERNQQRVGRKLGREDKVLGRGEFRLGESTEVQASGKKREEIRKIRRE